MESTSTVTTEREASRMPHKSHNSSPISDTSESLRSSRQESTFLTWKRETQSTQIFPIIFGPTPKLPTWCCQDSTRQQAMSLLLMQSALETVLHGINI